MFFSHFKLNNSIIIKIQRYICTLPWENGASMDCPIFKNRLNNIGKAY